MTLKTLVLDIETSPHVAYTFELWNTTIPHDHIIEPSRTLCFAAKWHGSRGTQFFSEWNDGREGMIAAAHELVSAADIVVGYNQDHFDTPVLQWEYALADLGVPAPHISVDLYKTIRRRFRPASRKLGYVANALGVGNKVKHEGFGLWASVMAEDPRAQKRMERYCRGDVILTDKLFDKVLPWIPNYPSRNLDPEVTGMGCPRCDGMMTRQGFAYTSTGRYRRYRCSNGHWSRAVSRSVGDTVRGIG